MFDSFLILCVLVLGCNSEDFLPCDGTNKVVVSPIPGLLPGEENQYILNVAQNVPANTKIMLRFDSEANLELSSRAQARISSTQDTAEVNVFTRSPLGIGLRVQGDVYGNMPYLKSLSINSIEYCEYPKTGYLDFLSGGNKFGSVGPPHPPPPPPSLSDPGCGKRKVEHTGLVVNGQPTKPGDWPWHVALLMYHGADLHYRCGGILLAKTKVLSAAHCVVGDNGEPYNPEIMFAVLGKYNLYGGERSTQEREVYKIIVHEHYNKDNFNNDISLLKLKSEAVYTDFVQPVCIWSPSCYDRLGGGTIFGTVVGWGYDLVSEVSEKMQKATMPIVPADECVKTKPEFYNKHMNGNNFCAGYSNGTSACNGDSGGSFSVFVPDRPGSTEGAYYVRGIVSATVRKPGSVYCDPDYNVLFTDVSKFGDWIARHMN